jgi:hypothetical protein
MSTGKKLSPMRAFQYSSALDTHSYPPAPVLESELDKLNREIMQKDMQIRFLKQNLEVPPGAVQLKDSSKNSSFLSPSHPTNGLLQQKSLYGSPVIKKHTIKLPDYRFNGFDPITGLNKSTSRSYSPFQEIGKRCVDNYGFQRPFFN